MDRTSRIKSGNKRCRPKTPYAFGCSTKRFSYLGVHPELLSIDQVKKQHTRHAFYIHQKKECIYKRLTGPYHWKTRLESEEFSKHLGFIRANKLNERIEQKRMGGPAAHEIKDDFKRQQSFCKKGNVHFGSAERWPGPRDVTPAPNSHNLDIIKSSSVNRRGFTDKPHLEWDGFRDRFADSETSYHLAPNRYNIKYLDGIEHTLKKKVSHLKGPYDMFTGPRDDTTIKNHFAPKKNITPEVYFIQPSDLDYLLHDKTKKRYGKFLLQSRFPDNMVMLRRIDPFIPAPGQYEVADSFVTAKKNQVPFNCSSRRFSQKCSLQPGPGRYSPPVKARCAGKRKTKQRVPIALRRRKRRAS